MLRVLLCWNMASNLGTLSGNMLIAGPWLVEHVIPGASAFCLRLHPNSLRIQLYVAAGDVRTENKVKDESP